MDELEIYDSALEKQAITVLAGGRFEPAATLRR
jgi:hypothetical protein